MFLSLLRSRKFAGLFWCQFLSAFNDNFVRNLLATLVLFRLGQTNAGALITLAIGIFILPSIFLSGLGGELADAYDKARIARWLKASEIFVQAIAAAGVFFNALPLLYVALFGLGTIAALFSPVKYGFLPENLKTEELPAGNALVEAATFLAILFGLVAGALAAKRIIAPGLVISQLMLVALAAYATSWLIPTKGAAAPGLHVHRNILASTKVLLRELHTAPNLWRPGLAVSWFWLTGAVALSLVPVAVRNATGGGIDVEAAISGFFALGIGVGSLLAAQLAHGRITLRPVPIAALGMALFLGALSWATHGIAGISHHEMSLTDFFASARGVAIAAEVFGLSTSGGLFVVPLFAAIQARAAPDRRARTVAAVNIQNSVFMVAGSLATSLLQSRFFGLGEAALLGLLGLCNVGAAAYVQRAVAGTVNKAI
jgi:acyl-[acyl-carrier-protein]-phospholipid O-acyltransferase/long-chain-fatty-acid--[acyl-carrier-protein] ligase